VDKYNLISFFGVFVLLGVAWILSNNRRIMNWRVIVLGVCLQLVFGLLVFRAPAGERFFLLVNDLVVKILDASTEGTRFVFGPLALPPGVTNEHGETSVGFILAFQAFPSIVFFSAVISILYFTRIMPMIVKGFAWMFTRLMKVSGAEALCAASNIFVGVESTLTVKPYLERMTRSELCTLLTAGMSTVASNVLALYVFCLRGTFEGIAGHLVSASILSAPAALVMSKILYPETDEPETLGETVEPHYERDSNVFAAVISGANSGAKLIFGIVALLLAVMGLVALLNLVLNGIGWRVNALAGWNVDWSLEGMLAVLFYPFGLIVGIPPADVPEIARLIGERAVLTEVPAYRELAVLIETGVLQHPRSAVIATYALCGFAHVAAVAIFVGGASAIAPSRTTDLSRVAGRALLAATLACLMTASVAGVFFSSDSFRMIAAP
jgi:CNT family concentrative nucleoside transporter